jgi:organic radical activating enzyme
VRFHPAHRLRQLWFRCSYCDTAYAFTEKGKKTFAGCRALRCSYCDTA